MNDEIFESPESLIFSSLRANSVWLAGQNCLLQYGAERAELSQGCPLTGLHRVDWHWQ